MSHRVKKDEKKREMRGPTFVGCRPVVEDGKRERKERMFQKHKNRKFEEQLAPTNCPGKNFFEKGIDKSLLLCYTVFRK